MNTTLVPQCLIDCWFVAYRDHPHSLKSVRVALTAPAWRRLAGGSGMCDALIERVVDARHATVQTCTEAWDYNAAQTCCFTIVDGDQDKLTIIALE